MDKLTHVVIHELKKRVGSEPPDTHLAAGILNVEDSTVSALATALVTVLGTPSNNVQYGQFRGAHRQGEFPTNVELFAKALSDAQFMTLSRVTMNELVVTANEKNFSTGGYICFVAYVSQGENFMLVAMAKERSGFLVDANLRPTTVQPIELSKLHQAARINLSRFLESIAADPTSATDVPLDLDQLADGTEDDEASEDAQHDVDQTYLCFIKGTADVVADYFQDALGCEPGISASRATGKLIRGIPRFLTGRSELRQYAQPVRRAVIGHLLEFTNEAPVDLSTVVSVARSAIPQPVPDEVIAELNTYLNSKCEIPSHFMVHGATVRRASVIRMKTPYYTLVFDENSVDVKDAAIIYNREDQSLTLSLDDKKVIARVEKAIQARGTMES